MKPSFALTAALTAILLACAAAAPANSSPSATTTTSGAPSAGGAPKGPAKLATPVRKTKASIDVTCDGKTFSLSTGTTTGACSATTNGGAVCVDGDVVTAQASCSTGCQMTRLNGSCTAK
jgi:hypothetical protein